MRILIQRVSKSSVIVENNTVGKIGKGFLIFLGVGEGDTQEDVDYLIEKCVNLRVFPNEKGKFHYSLLDVKGEVLVVSQFTLYASTRKGRRPDFSDAADPQISEELYEYFVKKIEKKGILVSTGVFGAKMDVEIHNDGPVTIMIDSEQKHRKRR
ncbi:MAG: D-aminoacyl-tRNA deacylase [Verrucomicrobiota bacterium]|nr:D-aminoacyl-tRNA deacylase [Verrucomicrobiota bacterium]